MIRILWVIIAGTVSFIIAFHLRQAYQAGTYLVS